MILLCHCYSTHYGHFLAQVEALLGQAMERRSVAATQLNEHSSRSHMVFTLRIDGTNATTGALRCSWA
jgi:kinesin family protein C1